MNDEGDPVCTHVVFARIPWGGHCGGACGDFLPYFLNQCRNCGLRVCNYCREARTFVPREQTVLAEGDAVEEGDEVQESDEYQEANEVQGSDQSQEGDEV